VPFKNIKPWPIPLVRNNQTTLFPMPPKKKHFEKQKRNLQLSLNIPIVPFGKGGEKGGKITSLHSTPPNLRNNSSEEGGKKLNSPLICI
jgi:hypothetical protein